jgi:5-methylcytosine-specific restriction endonuclease McrA
MPPLTPIEDGDEAHFLAVMNAKRGRRRARLRNAWPRIQSRYEEYANLTSGLEQLPACTLSGILRRDCKHCYDYSTAPLSILIFDVNQIVPICGSTLCQYCLLSELDAIDHYAPKSLFPEFSILSRNLVPACPKCNRLKGDVWLDNGMRVIINLYYDQIPNVRYLAVSVTFPSGANRAKVKFKLARPSGLSQAVFNQLRRHFDRLQLLKRYNLEGADYVSECLVDARTLAAKGRAAISPFFRSRATQLAALHGENHWKAVISLELSANVAFFKAAGCP